VWQPQNRSQGVDDMGVGSHRSFQDVPEHDFAKLTAAFVALDPNAVLVQAMDDIAVLFLRGPDRVD
jgi:hypothetical protein